MFCTAKACICERMSDMTVKIGVIAGDGIGPEIMRQARKVLDRAAEKCGFSPAYADIAMGGCSIDRFGEPLTEAALEEAESCSAVLLGAVGGDPRTSPWYALPPEKRPEAGLLALRKGLNLFVNLRPAHLYAELRGACPLREEALSRGIDLVIVRELTGGLYFGERRTFTKDGVRHAADTLTYTETEIRRAAVRAFETARARRKKVTHVDKANVLDSSRLWRSVVEETAADYPDVSLSHMLVDNCAMQLIRDPSSFDVILTENMFGDILSDEAAMLTGSIGMLSSASLNETGFGLYEPIHGSAPDLAGGDTANPMGTILSAAMLLRMSLGQSAAADLVEAAVQSVLREGYRTRDIWSEGCVCVGTERMGDLIAERV